MRRPRPARARARLLAPGARRRLACATSCHCGACGAVLARLHAVAAMLSERWRMARLTTSSEERSKSVRRSILLSLVSYKPLADRYAYTPQNRAENACCKRKALVLFVLSLKHSLPLSRRLARRRPGKQRRPRRVVVVVRFISVIFSHLLHVGDLLRDDEFGLVLVDDLSRRLHLVADATFSDAS